MKAAYQKLKLQFKSISIAVSLFTLGFNLFGGEVSSSGAASQAGPLSNVLFNSTPTPSQIDSLSSTSSVASYSSNCSISKSIETLSMMQMVPIFLPEQEVKINLPSFDPELGALQSVDIVFSWTATTNEQKDIHVDLRWTDGKSVEKEIFDFVNVTGPKNTSEHKIQRGVTRLTAPVSRVKLFNRPSNSTSEREKMIQPFQLAWHSQATGIKIHPKMPETELSSVAELAFHYHPRICAESSEMHFTAVELTK
jgi:hypothetical protein